MFLRRLYTFRHNHNINHVYESKKFVLVADQTKIYFWDRKTKALRHTKTFKTEIQKIHKLENIGCDVLTGYADAEYKGWKECKKFVFQSVKRLFNGSICIKIASLAKACLKGAVIIGDEHKINVNGTLIKHKYGNLLDVQNLHGYFFVSFEIGKICCVQERCLFEVFCINDVLVSFSWDQNSFYCCTLSGFLYKMELTVNALTSIVRAVQNAFEDGQTANISMHDIKDGLVTEQQYNVEELRISTLMVLDRYTDVGRKIKKVVAKDDVVVLHTVCGNLIFLNHNLEIEGFLEDVDDVFDRENGIYIVNGYDVTELEWGWR